MFSYLKYQMNLSYLILFYLSHYYWYCKKNNYKIPLKPKPIKNLENCINQKCAQHCNVLVYRRETNVASFRCAVLNSH